MSACFGCVSRPSTFSSLLCRRTGALDCRFSRTPSLHLSEYATAIPTSVERTAHALAQCADPRVVAWSEQLRLHHDEAFHRELVAMAEPVIVRAVELECRNLEKADAWNEANERGDPELVPYSELDVTQVLELEVADARLLAHLVPGLTWQTAMLREKRRDVRERSSTGLRRSRGTSRDGDLFTSRAAALLVRKGLRAAVAELRGGAWSGVGRCRRAHGDRHHVGLEPHQRGLPARSVWAASRLAGARSVACGDGVGPAARGDACTNGMSKGLNS